MIFDNEDFLISSVEIDGNFIIFGVIADLLNKFIKDKFFTAFLAVIRVEDLHYFSTGTPSKVQVYQRKLGSFESSDEAQQKCNAILEVIEEIGFERWYNSN